MGVPRPVVHPVMAFQPYPKMLYAEGGRTCIVTGPLDESHARASGWSESAAVMAEPVPVAEPQIVAPAPAVPVVDVPRSTSSPAKVGKKGR
jgi:hypothetical protein